MTTDYRALCAELLAALKSWSPHGGGPLECWEDREEEAALIARAEALLDQPEPAEPSLNRQALGALSRADKDALTNPLTGEVVALRTILNKEQSNTIRRALEALDN